jgi:hypothetical protein
MLADLLEPENARYPASQFGNLDASAQYAVAGWLVADPLAHYQLALRQNNERQIVAQNAFSSEQENGGRKSANDARTCTPDFLPPSCSKGPRMTL